MVAFSKWKVSTDLQAWKKILERRGVTCPGKIRLASADQALDPDFIRANGVTCLWECLRDFPEKRAELSAAISSLKGRSSHILLHQQWLHAHIPDRADQTADHFFEVVGTPARRRGCRCVLPAIQAPQPELACFFFHAMARFQFRRSFGLRARTPEDQN